MVAFVVGNGTSRKEIPLEPLKQYGKVYACNAVYRDFDPDYLIAVDAKMVFEICKSGYQQTHEVWTNPNQSYAKLSRLNFFSPSKGWSSGPTALDMASTQGHEKIYILGFDFVGTADDRINNIFAGTANYKKPTDKATYYGNWMRQTGLVIQKNKEKRYIRVVEDSSSFIPETLSKYANIEHITVEEFKNLFNLQ
jgi:hypothetical protein